jgi:hypothetical protein
MLTASLKCFHATSEPLDAAKLHLFSQFVIT